MVDNPAEDGGAPDGRRGPKDVDRAMDAARTPENEGMTGTPGPEGPGWVSRAAGAAGRGMRRATGWVSAGLLVAAVGGLIVAERPLEAKVVAIRAVTPRVKFDWPALRGEVSSEPKAPGGEPRTWVNGEIRSGLESLVLGRLTTDPFDGASLRSAREGLLETGWFKPDLTLSRDAEGTVRVRGTWRAPAAAVRYDGRDLLVSGAGELLPVRYAPDASGYKAIVGVFHEPPKPGEAWLGGDVKAALRLLELLAQLPGYEQVAGIDVTDFAGKRTLVIVTQSAGRITWGGPVDEFNPGQAEAATKLARLVQLHRETGRLDAGRPAIDVRFADNVYVQDTLGVLREGGAAEVSKTKAKGDGKAAAVGGAGKRAGRR